ncbi:hypothetical protein GCM10027515_29960 [Schumannella luteola]|uniref:AraC-like DNA-binding protein n=1 Tax=Schumannella luteola TaxID=472059 RepID=A0A852Y9U3_9MICO|nr:AraC-like DNA-binding protein [Schumannella luteola]
MDGPVTPTLAQRAPAVTPVATARASALADPASADDAAQRAEALDRALASLEWNVIESAHESLASGSVLSGGEAGFIYLREGSAVLEVAEATPLELTAGDIVFFAHPRLRTLRAHTPTQLVEVGVTPAGDRRSAALDALPDLLLVRDFDIHERPIVGLIESMCATRSKPIGSLRGGDAIICGRIVTTIASVAVRRWAESGCAPAHWLTGSVDAHIGRALSAVHTQLDRAWTVEELARIAAMSRSAFAARFRDVVGSSPAGYLASARMDAALDLLPRRELTVTEVARRLGYESEAGFSRAFRRHVGASPAEWRESRQRPAA